MKINIEMDKTEAKKYFNTKKKPTFKVDFKDRRTQGAFIIGGSLLVGLAAIALILEGFAPPPTPRDYSILLKLSWSQIFKLGGIIAFPFLIISWLIHGVQVRLLA